MLNLQDEIDALVTRIQGYTSEITISDLERQGDIVVELDGFKKCLKGGLTNINRVLTHASEHLCRTIANELQDVTYRHPKATITASARGFFTIEEPEFFVNWYDEQYGSGGLRMLMELVISKKKMSEFFENEVLKKGLSLPTGVKSHVIANCKIRRKTNGQKEENGFGDNF